MWLVEGFEKPSTHNLTSKYCSIKYFTLTVSIVHNFCSLLFLLEVLVCVSFFSWELMFIFWTYVTSEWYFQLFQVKVKVAESCPTLCDPMGYTVHGILQVRMLEWVAFPFSRGSSQARSPALQVDSWPAEPAGKPVHGQVKFRPLLYSLMRKSSSHRGCYNL